MLMCVVGWGSVSVSGEKAPPARAAAGEVDRGGGMVVGGGRVGK